jgi:hypothetical protein
MNYARIGLAAVAATVWDALYGFLMYGTLIAPEFAKYPGVYRSNEAGMAFLPLMFAGVFVAILAAAIIYAKGYEGGNGLAEGGRFGVLLGLFVVFAFSGVNYATLIINKKLAGMTAAAAFVEWAVVGVVVGLVYKPAPRVAARTVGAV